MTTRRARWWVGLSCSAHLWSTWVGVGVAQNADETAPQAEAVLEAAPQAETPLEAEPALHAEAPPEAEAAPDATLRPSRVNSSAPLSGGERWVKRDGRWALQRINYRYLDAPDYAPRPAPPPTLDDFATLPNVAVVLRTRWFGGPGWPGRRWGAVGVSPFGVGFGDYGYGGFGGLGYGAGYGWPGYGGGWGYGGWNGWNGWSGDGWNRRGSRRGWGVGTRRGSRFGFGLGWRLGGLVGF